MNVPPGRAGRRARRDDAGVAGNARLTAANAALLLVLLAIEGVTVLRVRALLTPHVFVGMLLVPPVLLKVASTGWRFARYYGGAPAYQRKGPPPVLLRLLGPVVVLLTLMLFASGVGLLLVSRSWLPLLPGPARLAAAEQAGRHRRGPAPVADRRQPGGRHPPRRPVPRPSRPLAGGGVRLAVAHSEAYSASSKLLYIVNASGVTNGRKLL